MLGTLSDIPSLNLQVMCNLMGDWYRCMPGYKGVASRRCWPAALFRMCALSRGILVLSLPCTHTYITCAHALSLAHMRIYFRVKISIIFQILSLVAFSEGFLTSSVLEQEVLNGYQAVLFPQMKFSLPPACTLQMLCVCLPTCFPVPTSGLVVNWFISPVNGPILRVAEKPTHHWSNVHSGVLKHTKSTWLLCVLDVCLSTGWGCCAI